MLSHRTPGKREHTHDYSCSTVRMQYSLPAISLLATEQVGRLGTPHYLGTLHYPTLPDLPFHARAAVSSVISRLQCYTLVVLCSKNLNDVYVYHEYEAWITKFPLCKILT